MAPTTKEGQRAELHKTIWRIANDLRGSVDGWDFKSYVLGILFYRFISENLANYINEGELKAGDNHFDYVVLSDENAERRIRSSPRAYSPLQTKFSSSKRSVLIWPSSWPISATFETPLLSCSFLAGSRKYRSRLIMG